MTARTQCTMFHLKHARSRGWLSWEELGCLSRSLGFQVDLFGNNVTNEISYDDQGLRLEEVYRMLDYRLLHKAVHLSCNIHTDNWNVAVIRKAVNLLQHRAFTFEELHCIRGAYQLYEQQDSKGMLLQERILLRAIKMCGRTIAPLKLMHRIKHMKGAFVEPGRIQLDEFLDFILWCDEYVGFKPSDMEDSQGKDNQLFKLVDFKRLMSHHDGRLAERLDARYLSEEWDFGEETLGSKRVSKEPPVNSQTRIHQVERQKQEYRPLRSEVCRSEQRVYRSRIGFVRPRPLTAPDLRRYATPDARDSSALADHAPLSVNDVIQKVFKKTGGSAKSPERTPLRPMTTDRHRETSLVVTSGDEEDAENKMNDLLFDMETLEGRYEHETERDRQFLLPNYKPAKTKEKVKDAPILQQMHKPQKISMEERINHLVYPRTPSKLSHSKSCDARFRGWYAVNAGSGKQYIVTSPTHQRSPQARLHQRLSEKSAREIRHLHGDYLYRESQNRRSGSQSTRKSRTSRPLTAPSLSVSRSFTMTPNSESSPAQARDENNSSDETSNLLDEDANYGLEELTIHEAGSPQRFPEEDAFHTESNESRFFEARNPPLNKIAGVTSDCEESVQIELGETKVRQCKSAGESRVTKTSGARPHTTDSAKVSKTANFEVKESCAHGDFPMADSEGQILEAERFSPPLPETSMTHSKPSVFKVGQIGEISLLENIAEDTHFESLAEKTDRVENITKCTVSEKLVGLCEDSESGHTCSSQDKLDLDEDPDELRKLQAIAMLSIYTHRFANSRRGKRQKHRSPLANRESCDNLIPKCDNLIPKKQQPTPPWCRKINRDKSRPTRRVVAV